MDKLMEILGKYDGIIGTLLGVALTMSLTEYLKRLGKLKFYITQKEVTFKVKRKNEHRETILEVTDDKEVANFLLVDVLIEIYNSSDTPNILRDVKLSLYDNNQCKLSVIPEDKTTEKFMSAAYHREEFRHINIKPKEIIALHLVYYFNKEQVDEIKNCNKLFLESRGSDGKRHKVLVDELG
ncbi:hypothetical protein GNQ08_27170 [Paenibacillus macerans]|uniref:Uncharacterized protein n=1 Tax=Paenibacillus macerans TaxID=44252 RepID=A0A6N8F0N3_PAEMA|nr:hypothetical protein [Paenibacillus macerans]MDU5946978.1 hypothetical protein [Paenibacillus macerans]MUG26047.1 hypothetical protein [Paenibacillus macerans]